MWIIMTWVAMGTALFLMVKDQFDEVRDEETLIQRIIVDLISIALAPFGLIYVICKKLSSK